MKDSGGKLRVKRSESPLVQKLGPPLKDQTVESVLFGNQIWTSAFTAMSNSANGEYNTQLLFGHERNPQTGL